MRSGRAGQKGEMWPVTRNEVKRGSCFNAGCREEQGGKLRQRYSQSCKCAVVERVKDEMACGRIAFFSRIVREG